MVVIVNMVGSGDLSREIRLEKLAEDLELPEVRYDPELYPGLYLKFEEDGPLVVVFRTGKYIISGVDTVTRLEQTHRRLLNLFVDLDLAEEPSDTSFGIRNIVCTGELGREVELSALAVALGLENVEYEPEQFPGLIYRSNDYSGVCLLFTSGKVVVTGVSNEAAAEQAFQNLKSRIDELINS